MSQMRIKPRCCGQTRRLARRIPDAVTLEAALAGLMPLERAAMLGALRPHLSFVPPQGSPHETTDSDAGESGRSAQGEA